MPTECLGGDQNARLELMADWSSVITSTARNTAKVALELEGRRNCMGIDLWKSVDDSMQRVIWLARCKRFSGLQALALRISVLYMTYSDLFVT